MTHSYPAGRRPATAPRSVCPGGHVKPVPVKLDMMAYVSLDDKTIERLDTLRVEDESYDDLVNELINIYETEERTLFKSE